MPIICPSILASSEDEYKQQVERVTHFAHRIQIDLTDGVFAQPMTVSADKAWWPVGFMADFHLMYKDPTEAIKIIMQHKPHMLIVHAEAEGDFEEVAKFCHQYQVKIGVALLQKTPAETILPALNYIDHVLVFGGNLGHYGGHADLSQLEKVEVLKKHKSNLEVGWDGGVNDQNISQLTFAGIDVLNVGGYIQKSDNPERAYKTLERIAQETGTT